LIAAEPALRQAGARRVIRLSVSGPFHSPWMADVTDGLARVIDRAEWHDADPPVISNVTAEPVQDAGMIRGLLAEQVRSPVEWVASIGRMVRDGVEIFIECGPGTALTGMVKRIAPEARTLNVSDMATLESAAAALRGLPVRTPA
jgi:[acyl-carrier-protein] S-malonyltransferase